MNQEKSDLLYTEIDRNSLFEGTANKEDRSNMNVCFVLNDDSKEKIFNSMCKESGISGIKGHRSVGGYRASIYNAMPIKSVQLLVDIMKKLEKNNMTKILANDGLSQSGIDALTSIGFKVVTDKVDQDNLINAINSENYEVLLVRSATTVFRKDLIDSCPQLKIIGRGGVGMDNIDVDYAKKKELDVINTVAASSNSVAELVFAHLL